MDWQRAKWGLSLQSVLEMTRMGQVGAGEMERNAWLHDVFCMYKVLADGLGGGMRKIWARVRTVDFVKATLCTMVLLTKKGKSWEKKSFTLDTNILSFHDYSKAFVDPDSKDHCITEETIFI